MEEITYTEELPEESVKKIAKILANMLEGGQCGTCGAYTNNPSGYCDACLSSTSHDFT